MAQQLGGKMLPADGPQPRQFPGGKIAGEHCGQYKQQRIRQLCQKAIDQGKQLFIQGRGQRAAGMDDLLGPIGKCISHTPGQQIGQVLGPVAKGGKSLGGGRHQLRQSVIQSAELAEQQPGQQPKGQSQHQQHPGDAEGGADSSAQGKPPLDQANQWIRDKILRYFVVSSMDLPPDR